MGHQAKRGLRIRKNPRAIIALLVIYRIAKDARSAQFELRLTRCLSGECRLRENSHEFHR